MHTSAQQGCTARCSKHVYVKVSASLGMLAAPEEYIRLERAQITAGRLPCLSAQRQPTAAAAAAFSRTADMPGRRPPLRL